MTTYRVILSDAALGSVREYLSYLAYERKAPEAAKRWWRKALAKVDSLKTLPHRCPRAPEDALHRQTIRMLIVDQCLFLYRINEIDRVVRVLDFRHGSRMPRPLDDADG